MEHRFTAFMSKVLMGVIIVLLFMIVKLLVLVESIYDIIEPKTAIVKELTFEKTKCQLNLQPGEVCVLGFSPTKETKDGSTTPP